MKPKTQEKKPEQISGKIQLCPDGKYRWIYEYDMLKNPSILLTIWKVMGVSATIVAVFVFLISLPDIFRYGFHFDANNAKVIGILICVFFLISIIAYLVVAKSYGWKYVVLFEMDEKSVVHIHMPKQFKKAKAIAWLTAMAGIASGSPGYTGQGVLAGTHDRTTSDFVSVRKVVVNRKRNTVFLNHTLIRNQIYARDDEFDFVVDYICKRCINAKVVK